MRWLAIINPNANHHTKEQLQRLARTLRRLLGVPAVWTSRPNQAGEIVARNPGYDGYVAVGGDGTVAEIVNAIDEERQAVGIIPAGTANDLARSLGIETETAGIQALNREHLHRLDYIDVHFHGRNGWRRHKMITICSVGYAAETTAFYQRHCKPRRLASYSLAAVLQAFRQKSFNARLRFDGGDWKDMPLTNLVVQNTRCAGGFCLFPEASLDDGKLNLLYGRLNRMQQLFEDLGIVTSTFLFESSRRAQACNLDIEISPPSLFMVDGDLHENIDAISCSVKSRQLACAE